MRKLLFTISLMMLCAVSYSQIGSHRNDLSIGINGGYVLSDVGFDPKVNQSMHSGMTAGLSFRYVCEKYFNTVCAIQAEVNYASIGWKEDIINMDNGPVINPVTGVAETYSRTINYIQIPIFAHLGWGREQKGFQFFFQAGPQIGIYLSESSEASFPLDNINTEERSSNTTEQYFMPVENKFDYGIAAGLGVEYSNKRIGHVQLEGRYYYGLGNIYGDSKKDYFGKSNFGNIVIKMTYLFDSIKTKNI